MDVMRVWSVGGRSWRQNYLLPKVRTNKKWGIFFGGDISLQTLLRRDHNPRTIFTPIFTSTLIMDTSNERF